VNPVPKVVQPASYNPDDPPLPYEVAMYQAKKEYQALLQREREAAKHKGGRRRMSRLNVRPELDD